MTSEISIFSTSALISRSHVSTRPLQVEAQRLAQASAAEQSRLAAMQQDVAQVHVHTRPRRCPLARFLRICGQLGVQARLPACLSLGKTQNETSWHSLLEHLRRRTSAPDGDVAFRNDVDIVSASWTAIRRRLRGRGIRQPRQLVLDPWAQPAVWLLPETMARRPHWLEALRRVLNRVDTAAIFQRIDRGGGAPIPAHQALLREVIAGLKDPQVPASRLFESELWNRVRSTAPLSCWVASMRRRGLISTLQSESV